jgi:hypothetical protein
MDTHEVASSNPGPLEGATVSWLISGYHPAKWLQKDLGYCLLFTVKNFITARGESQNSVH